MTGALPIFYVAVAHVGGDRRRLSNPPEVDAAGLVAEPCPALRRAQLDRHGIEFGGWRPELRLERGIGSPYVADAALRQHHCPGFGRAPVGEPQLHARALIAPVRNVFGLD